MTAACFTLLLAIPSQASAGETPGEDASREGVAKAGRPNVVFILADDLGYGDLGCYGQKIIRTPNIDRIAAEGLKLTAHYSGNQVCAPSRCTLMTAMHPGHAIIRSNREVKPEGQWPIPEETVTLADAFADAGYQCGGFGKWGLGGPNSEGEPLNQGFHRWYGYNCQRVAHSFYPTSLWSDREVVPLNNRAGLAHAKMPAGFDPNLRSSYDWTRGEDYSADLIAGAAVEWLKQVAEDGPFFLFHPSTIPHLALQAPKEAVAEYSDLPDEPYPGGNGYMPAFRPRSTYAAMVTRLDTHVGQLMAVLEEAGVADNTLIIFTSDNGPAYNRLGGTDSEFFQSAGGFRGFKGDLFEGGVRVPCVAKLPGVIEPGRVSDARSGFEDWMPTLGELCGLNVPDGVDGQSLAALLRGESESGRDMLYRETPGYKGQQAVWSGKWKLLRRGLNKKKDPTEGQMLFDLAADPAETTDVSADHPEVVAELSAIAAREHRRSDVFPIRALDKASAR